MKTRKRTDTTVTLQCDCVGKCSIIKFVFDTWSEKDPSWEVYVQWFIDLYYRGSILRLIWERIKLAFNVLIGREYLFMDITVQPEQILQFIHEMNETATKYAETAALARHQIMSRKIEFPLKTEEDYYAALEKLDILMDIQKGDPREVELELLSQYIEKYENERYPFTVDDKYSE